MRNDVVERPGVGGEVGEVLLRERDVRQPEVAGAAKFEFRYRPQKPDGSLDAARTFTFDCKANKAG